MTRWGRITLGIIALVGLVIPLGNAGVANAAEVQGVCYSDASSLVQICIDQYYSSYTSSGIEYVAVDHYAFRFTILDRQISLRQGSLTAAVSGRCGNNCSGFVAGNALFTTPSPPANGVWYIATPSWRGKYASMGGGGVQYQCANARIIYMRGVSTYQFDDPVNLCKGFDPITDINR